MMEMKEEDGENRDNLGPDRGGGQEEGRRMTTKKHGRGRARLRQKEERQKWREEEEEEERGSRVERVDEPEGR